MELRVLGYRKPAKKKVRGLRLKRYCEEVLVADKVQFLAGKGKDKSLERSVSVEQAIAAKVVPSILLKIWCNYWGQVMSRGKKCKNAAKIGSG